MIIKKIPNPKKSASKSARAVGLANYITEPERDNGLEKCIHHEAENFLTSTHEAQVAEMVALSEEAIRSKDPIDHWVISWKSDERPTVEQAREAVKIFIGHCGLKGHQVIWGLHDDTQNMHVHIAVNRVHPDTLKVVKINKGFDKEAGQQVGVLIEYSQGWQPEKGSRYQIINGKPVRREQKADRSLEPTTKARDMELQTGAKSAQRIGIEQAGPIISKAKSWKELHDGLETLGMEYRKEGSGAKVYVDDIPVKASDIDRKASLPALQKRLGHYQSRQELKNDYTKHTIINPFQSHFIEAGQSPRLSMRQLSSSRLAHSEKDGEGNRRFEGILQIDERVGGRQYRGVRRGGDSDRESKLTRLIPLKDYQAGWNEYQLIKAERRAAKDMATTELRTRQEAQRNALFEKQKAERTEIFSKSWKGKGELRNAMQSVLATAHAADKLDLQEKQRAERTELFAKHAPLPQYKAWQEQPQIVALKQQSSIEQNITLRNQSQQLSRLVRSLTHLTDVRGHVTYKSAGVSVFRDEGKILAVLDANSQQSIAVALAVAQQKFGQTLTLTGSYEFQRSAVAAAVENNMTVKFSDKNLEAMRIKMANDKRLAEREAVKVKVKEQLTSLESQKNAQGIPEKFEPTLGIDQSKHPKVPSGTVPVVVPPELPEVAATFTTPNELHDLLAIANKQSLEKAATLTAGKSVIDTEDGKTYGGKILGVTEFHVIQNNGATVVIHSKVNLDHIPKTDEITDIKYKDGKGIVANKKKDTQEKGIGR